MKHTGSLEDLKTIIDRQKRGVSMRCLALLMLVLATVGCTTTSHVMRLDKTPRAPTPLSEVAVLVEEPSRQYSVIAMVEVSDQGWDLSLEELEQSMLEQAAALGGDAVIVGMSTSQSGRPSSQLEICITGLTKSKRSS